MPNLSNSRTVNGDQRRRAFPSTRCARGTCAFLFGIVFAFAVDLRGQDASGAGAGAQPVDQDADGLSDSWEVQHFGDLAVRAEDDPDLDTLSNIFEYEVGTNPKSADSDSDGRPDSVGIRGYLDQEIWPELEKPHPRDHYPRHLFNAPGASRFLHPGAAVYKVQAEPFRQRLRGTIVAPVTGDYEFWIAGNNWCELWLGENESQFSARRMAGIQGGKRITSRWRYDKYPSQKSQVVQLVAGEEYYLEILYRHNHNKSYQVSVAWTPPGGKRSVIPPGVLRSWVPDPEVGDDDGIREAWKVATRLEPGRNAAMEDPDGDGIVNVVEFERASDPKVRDAVPGLLNWSRWYDVKYAVLTDFKVGNFRRSLEGERDPDHRGAAPADGFRLPNLRGSGTITVDRLHGEISAPESGLYTFWIMGKASAELSISPDAHGFNKRPIARSSRGGSSGVVENGCLTVRSVPVWLEKGEKHFVEAMYTPEFGNHRLHVGWRRHEPRSWSESELGGGASGQWSDQVDSMTARVRGNATFGGAAGDGLLFRHSTAENVAEAICRLDSPDSLAKGAGGGLMFRSSLDPFAAFFALSLDSEGKLFFNHRPEPLGTEVTKYVANYHNGKFWNEDSIWLRLRSDGVTCIALFSVDGVAWTEAARLKLELGEEPVAGPFAWGGPGVEPVDVKFSSVVLGGLFPSAEVPASALATAAFDPLDADGDALPDAWEVLHGLDPADPHQESGPYGDSDQDGYTNQKEWRLGGDPRQQGGFPGYLSRERWKNLTGSRVSDLTESARFKGKPDLRDLISSPDLRGGDCFNYGQRIRGTLVAPATGTYRFWIAGDDGSSLALSDSADPFDRRVIAGVDGASPKIHEWDKHPSQASAAIQLVGGREYYIEILHKEGGGPDHVAVAWEYATPNGTVHAREILPSRVLKSNVPDIRDRDDDGLPDEWESLMGLNPQDNGYHDVKREGSEGDYDGDRLTNREEYLLGTHPCMADSEGDGVDDYDEVRLYGSDPLRNDLAPPKKLADLRLETYRATSGDWVLRPDGALGSVSRRGTLEFTFTVAKAGIHLIELEALARSASGYAPAIPVSASVDLIELGSGEVAAAGSRLRWLTAWLSPGEHTVTIHNRNVRAGVSLQISSLSVYHHDGEDLDRNGVPDWIDAFMRRNAGVSASPGGSAVSPAFIEGTSRVPGTTSILAESGVIKVQLGLSNRWFANIPLESSHETNFTVSLENGAVREERVMRWVATNLFDSPDKIRVRLGDSLKLTAEPLGNPREATEATVTINGELLGPVTAGEPRVVTFDKPGITTLMATASWDGEAIEAAVAVEVVTADFGPQLAVSAGTPRTWDLPGVPHSLVIEADKPLALVESGRRSPDSRKLVASYPRRTSGTPRVLARLWENGPVVASTSVNAFHVVPASATGNHRVIEVLPDGTRVVEVRYVFNGVIPDNLSVWLQLYVTDAVFGNGDTWYQLTARDFDENGEARLLIYKAPGQGVAYVCHWFRPFHDDPADGASPAPSEGNVAPDAAEPSAPPTEP